ncbi:AAA family ATPase [Labilibaculum manganireducens]|uniref:AAA family ATPase n=1 Tax=Labilibaculum manganireducens TaxID=1940525 RepID=UPI0029F554CF|nr:AAA family ATPase [Labilibaculum manganireducens]
MKKIGFKNFRRFVELAPLELGEITLMVGKNNSGKSTLVKALLLVLDYLRNQQGETFSFANESLNDANIVTFERAKCKLQNEPTIDFSFELENYQIEISINGEDKWTFADVSKIIIRDTSISLELVIDYLTKTVRISKETQKTSETFDVGTVKKELRKKIAQQKKELDGLSKTSREGLSLINIINTLNKKLDELDSRTIEDDSTDVEYRLEYPLKDFSTTSTEESIFEEIVSDFLSRNYDLRVFYIGKREETSTLTDEENEQFEQINGIDGEKNNIKDSITNLVHLLNTKKVFYLGANPSKQSALFNLRDKENALAQAIHQFYQLKIQPGDPEYLFIEYWMKEFNIGNSFEIEFISGEAYECYIVNGKVKTHLADMGMGSLQLMQLLFRIATMIRIYKKETKGINLIVEEPELNLHPSLQSELADFFFEINDKYGIKFIIETHSEYIIRRTQVIGLKKGLFIDQELNPNPFKVYYFHLSEGPYPMNYTDEGKFDRSFAKGFTNVATDSTKEMLKLNRK